LALNQAFADRMLLVKVCAEATEPNKAKSAFPLDPLSGSPPPEA
jgi:hypothetical protein